MTTIIIHNGFIVADSAVRHRGLDVSNLDDLYKLTRFTDPIKVWSERAKFEDVALGFAFTGPRSATNEFITRLMAGIPIDNVVDFYTDVRTSGLGSFGNTCSIALVCVHHVFVVELNPTGEEVEFFPHGNYEGDAYPRLFGLGTGSGEIEHVVDIFNTFQQRMGIKEMKEAKIRINPMALAISCAARDPESGNSFGLWRVVPDGKGSAEILMMGRRGQESKDRLQAADLTELIPLDLWNEHGELPYDPITYPAPPPYSKDQPQEETSDVAGKAVREDGDRSPEGKGPEGRSRVPRKDRSRDGKGNPGGGGRNRRGAGSEP